MWWLVFAIVMFASTSALAQAVGQENALMVRFNEMATLRTIDFDHYPDGEPVPEGYTVHDQWSSLGVVFTMGDSSRAAYAVPHSCSLTAPNHVGGDPVVIAWFVDPITGAPAVTDFVGTAQDNCWGPGEGILMQAYDIRGQLVAQEWNVGSGNSATFSFPRPVVAKLRMTEFQQGIDNFTFNTPVPTGPTDAPGVPIAGGAVLRQNCPNPFNPRTTIEYDLPEPGPVRLSVFDVAGRLVRPLVDENMPQGSHEAVWDGRDTSGREVASGSYLARLEFAGKVETVRMELVR